MHLRRLRHYAVIAGLAATDASAFASGYFLFRFGNHMPAFVLPGFHANDPSSAMDIYLIMGAFFIAIRYLLGDYGRRQPFWDGARATTNTVALIALPDVLLVGMIGNGRLWVPLILSWAFLLPAIPIYRQCARAGMSRLGLWKIRTALIGSGEDAADIYATLRDSLSLGFDIRCLVLDGQERDLPPILAGLERISTRNSMSVIAKLQSAGCVQAIVAAQDIQRADSTEIIQRLIGADVMVAIIPSLRGLPLFGLSTNYLFGKDLLLLQVRNNLARLPSRLIKRIMDLIVPLVALILLSPVLAAIMAAIKFDDGGPIFFVQRRVGRGGSQFPCLKFRTMSVDAEDKLAHWQDENPELYAEYVRNNFKLRDDTRITRVGRLLRRYSLDELPQIVNVLLGKMSLVGPRPLLAREVPDYGPAIELYQWTNPGITGLWQISGRSETRFADRVSYDEWYILNWSLWYDVVILIQTAWIVLSGKGAF